MVFKRLVSGIVLSLLIVSMFAFSFSIQPVKASGTIYIRADGSIDPPTAPISTIDNVTYTLTNNITCSGDGIIGERDNIAINGNGYTLQGNGIECGINITMERKNVILRNTDIQGFNYGIWAGPFSSVTVSKNNIETCTNGLILGECSSCNVSENNITTCAYGIYAKSGSGSVISENTITSCENGIRMSLCHYNITKNNISKGGNGITVRASLIGGGPITENNITNNSGWGIDVREAGGTISGNRITNNGGGISLIESYGRVTGNIIANNTGSGITLYDASNSIISENAITGNGGNAIFVGTTWSTSFPLKIIGNTILNNHGAGVRTYLPNSPQGWVPEITSNNITGNDYGAWIGSSATIYHNNFTDNTNQAYVDYGYGEPIIVWDDGYPSGGNYWSNYNTTDLYSGYNQNEIGSDGIGDTPYIIDVNNTDNYPLMLPYKGHNIAVTDIETQKTIVAQGSVHKIYVDVSNIGSFPETFSLTAYANGTEIQTLAVTLASSNSTKAKFYWDTTGFFCGNYTLSACAWPVPAETDTSDNSLANLTIYVGIPGDVAPSYGQVDMKDIGTVVKAFGSIPGHPKWNSNADINDDGKVDMKDVGITVQHFGETES